MKFIDPELLRPLRSQLKAHAASGIASEAGIARVLLALLDAALAHADRIAAAERAVVETGIEWRDLDRRRHGPLTNADGDALDLRIIAHTEALDRLASLRQSPGTTDADAFYGAYPITVVKDRYNGTYSRGRWVAWNLGAAPHQTYADDDVCMDFWDGMRNAARVGSTSYGIHGLGDTAADAIADLEVKVRAAELRRALG